MIGYINKEKHIKKLSLGRKEVFGAAKSVVEPELGLSWGGFIPSCVVDNLLDPECLNGSTPRKDPEWFGWTS